MLLKVQCSKEKRYWLFQEEWILTQRLGGVSCHRKLWKKWSSTYCHWTSGRKASTVLRLLLRGFLQVSPPWTRAQRGDNKVGRAQHDGHQGLLVWAAASPVFCSCHSALRQPEPAHSWDFSGQRAWDIQFSSSWCLSFRGWKGCQELILKNIDKNLRGCQA